MEASTASDRGDSSIWELVLRRLFLWFLWQKRNPDVGSHRERQTDDYYQQEVVADVIKGRHSVQADASRCKRPYITTKDLGGWRGLGWFWTAILATVSVTASLLQILGPPRSDRGHLAGTAMGPEQASAEPGPAPPIAIAGPPSGESQPGNDTAFRSATPADMQMARKPESAALGDVVADWAVPDESPRTTPGLPASAEGTLSRTDKERSKKSAATMPTTAPQRFAGLGLAIHYSAKSVSSGPEAIRVAARLGPGFDTTETELETEVPQTAIIRFFSSEDHSTARAVASMLGELGYAWRIENFSTRRPSGARRIEVWLPLGPRF
jgi:hypothetical protein